MTAELTKSADSSRRSEQVQFEQRLDRYLAKVRRAFDIEAVLRDGVDEQAERDEIIRYYESSRLGYRLVHSRSGSIHMALNCDGEFHRDGYFGQVRLAQAAIDRASPGRVLELASGLGFNSIALARSNPSVSFVGVDLTPSHVASASQAASGLHNLTFEQGDFQHLRFDDNSFDVIFVVESLCHAPNMALALEEARRLLVPGGEFVVIDGFRTPQFRNLDHRLQLAARLVEHAMEVDHSIQIDQWLDLARTSGFRVEQVEDLTDCIKPNLRRLQWFAKGFFKFEPMTRLLSSILPSLLVRNAIAGLLMPLTVDAGAQGYWHVRLAK